MIKVLFQGDSITDAGRRKEEDTPDRGWGQGYPTTVGHSLIAAEWIKAWNTLNI